MPRSLPPSTSIRPSNRPSNRPSICPPVRPLAGPTGFTLVELLVVIGIIAVLISILLPTLGRARQQAWNVQCLSSMRQLGAFALMYNNEFKGAGVPWAAGATFGSTFLNAPYWNETINTRYMRGQTASDQFFVCPVVRDALLGSSNIPTSKPQFRSYQINGFVSGFYDPNNMDGSSPVSYPKGNPGVGTVSLDYSAAWRVNVAKIKRSTEVMLFTETMTLNPFASTNSANGVVFRAWNAGSGAKGDSDPIHFRKAYPTVNAGSQQWFPAKGSVNMAFLDGHAETRPWDKSRVGLPTPGVIANPVTMK